MNETQNKGYLNLIEITPDIASLFLSRNISNRKITMRNVQSIVMALQKNEWMLNGETIKFDNKGNLIDGQHRLMACIMSGISFKTYVINGLSSESFSTIDIGSKRTSADILSINNVENSNRIAAIIKCYLDEKITGTFGKSPMGVSSKSILAEYQSNPEVYQKLALANDSVIKFLTSPFFGISKSAFDIYGDDWFDGCVDKIKTGQNLQYGDPCLALREWAIANKGKASTQMVRAIYVKAVKAMATGKQVKVLKYTENEKFPTLI